jgi:hypothetical protein
LANDLANFITEYFLSSEVSVLLKLWYTISVHQAKSTHPVQGVDQTKLGDTHKLAAYKQLSHLTEVAAGSTTAACQASRWRVGTAEGSNNHLTNTRPPG